MRISFFIPYWLPAVYLLTGLVLWLPLEWVARKKIHRPPPFWRGLWRGVKERPWVPLLIAVAWPAAVWEAFR